MKMKSKWIGLVPAAFLVIGIAGCASTPQPYTYHDDRDEKPGPGLFSGEKGGFIIQGWHAEKTPEKDKATTEKAHP